jgi:hypothetical protein
MKHLTWFASTTEVSVRRLAIYCCAVVLAGCAKAKEEPAMDATAAAPAPEAPMGPAPIALADVAGKWAVRVMPETGDSVLLSYELVASEDPSGWTSNFPKRPPLPLRVTPGGDSIVTEAGPYESLLRKGVQVTTRSVTRLVDGKMVGTTTAHYATSGADTVRYLRFEGTRVP